MASRSLSPSNEASSPEARHLEALKAAHGAVEPCIVALDDVLTAHDLAVPAEFSTVRHRLARANLTRSQVAQAACGHLLSSMPPAEAEGLRDLRQREIAHSQLISHHIRHWTPQVVEQDWPGYRAATRQVLDQVRQLVAKERTLLLPALERTL